MKNILLLIIGSFLIAQDVPKSELENVIVLPFTKKREIFKYMKTVVAPGLGVKCNFCHDPNDYASDSKKEKMIARDMMLMVQGVNKNTMKKIGHDDISCWICHRGNTEPEHYK
ncbi:MAG: c-type cytochrome [Candidatus Marinimicrobia bacterium]|jgi:photosynthetic reaction center cytochrome c subunit|nr:c-type cytochrome [Candidatus Neomarinimicrobiota bacterium]MBT3617916.1 c-type cytochrome [Candidatus Neomarinimicrobiota bacterium]MBT3828753.1 c-type cytochrome [Candidatus Neomarinimicrobiota bacterium]MBT3997044.1 c-type cytochrome [Candidatus Neomarinimicrobiota bacterium]MBT4280800.1 c-type cytochrome [Candidatus Neomarinimicrobiota bacterium]